LYNSRTCAISNQFEVIIMRRNLPAPRLATTALFLLTFFALLHIIPSGSECVFAQQPTREKLPSGLQYVPADAALFVHVDVAKIWQNPILKSIRKADPQVFDDLETHARTEFGLSAEDLQTAVLFMPRIKGPEDAGRAGIILTFRKPYNKEKLEKGVAKFLRRDAKIKVVPLEERVALLLVNLGDEYAKPQPVGSTGPLSAALGEAAAGNHAAFIGSNLASLPEEIRGDDLPAPFRPFQPLLRSSTITASLDLGKTIDLDVRVKAATESKAIDCEKSLGALLALIQTFIGDRIKEFEADTNGMGMKDLLVLLKTGVAAAKGAKFSTTGTEVKLTVSIPTDLPFTSAYLAAKQKLMDAASQARSANNLKQIAIALHNYHDTYGAFPPAAVCGKKGNPQLSWRVLILPFIEQSNLYQEFKLDEPWDSAHNKKLLAKMPNVYAMPSKAKEGDTNTYYRVFVGKGAGFDWVTGTKITSITDGTSQTLMCVTAADAVPWTKPDELDFDPEKDMTKLLDALLNGKVQAAMFDGSVHTFSKIPDKKTLNALITRDGGEIIPEIP
jgi:hypothetical protein